MVRTEKPPTDLELRRRVQDLIQYRGGGANEENVADLIENALKYTPETSPVEIAARASDSAVSVQVLDRGRGFAPGNESRVFDKFFRGRSDEVRGAGLGLAICRAIIEAHGGSIRAENRRDGGAVICFQIPIKDAP